jgi:hypothetical protein
MNGTPFKLATIARVNTSTKPFAALVLGDEAIDLSAAHTAYRAARGGPTLSATDSILALLEDWDANFAVLQEMIAFIEKDGVPAGAAVAQAGVRIFAPVLRPAKCSMLLRTFRNTSTR